MRHNFQSSTAFKFVIRRKRGEEKERERERGGEGERERERQSSNLIQEHPRHKASSKFHAIKRPLELSAQ